MSLQRMRKLLINFAFKIEYSVQSEKNRFERLRILILKILWRLKMTLRAALLLVIVVITWHNVDGCRSKGSTCDKHIQCCSTFCAGKCMSHNYGGKDEKGVAEKVVKFLDQFNDEW